MRTASSAKNPGVFIDLHLHLVPGVDDGAETLEESVAMARVLADHGYEGAAVTPHIRPALFDNEAPALREGVARLGAELAAAGVPFAVRPGAEHYLEASVVERILAGEGLPLGGEGRFVLIETPTFGPVPGLLDLVFRLRVKGLTPVFAHPERCAVFHEKGAARRVVEAGAFLQLDLGSLAGAYGFRARRVARRLLSDGLYAVGGTDLHDPAQAEASLGRWLSTLTKAAGAEGRDRLLDENPRRLLEGTLS